MVNAILIVSIAVSTAAIALAVWSMCKLAGVNRELDNMDHQMAVMEAEAAAMTHRMTQHATEEVGQ